MILDHEMESSKHMRYLTIRFYNLFYMNFKQLGDVRWKLFLIWKQLQADNHVLFVNSTSCRNDISVEIHQLMRKIYNYQYLWLLNDFFLNTQSIFSIMIVR